MGAFIEIESVYELTDDSLYSDTNPFKNISFLFISAREEVHLC